MDIQEVKQLALQDEDILSETEISNIKIKLGKSKRSEKDWDFIKGLLRGKSMFTIQPVDESRLARFGIDGILYDNGVLQIFTNLEDCEEYARRYAAVRIGRYYTIGTIPFETVIRIAGEHEKNVYIDVRHEHNERFLVYDGKTKTLHLCINQKM